jgi:DNA-binding beta-propeller fold protein YncE
MIPLGCPVTSRRRITGGAHYLSTLDRIVFAAMLTIFAVLVSWMLGCSEANMHTEAQSRKSAPPSLQYIGAWGSKGAEPGQLDKPASIAVDALGNSYVADVGSHFIHKFGARGTPLLSFQDTLLNHPQSITVDSGGAMYVTDPVRGSVFIFFPSGDRYRILRLATRPNAENVLSVAVDDTGFIYVLDAGARKVFTFTQRLRPARTWQLSGGDPSSRGYGGAIAAGPDGFLYVVDPTAERVLRFASDGHVVSEISATADGIDRKLSEEFAVSSKYIFAMDADGRMLHVWAIDGKPELDVDLAPELGQGARFAPALAASPHGELLVLDDAGARVLRYRINF